MKVLVGVIGLIIVVGGLFFVLSSPQNEQPINQASSETISMTTIESDMANGSLLVDVRTPEEFSDGHIDGSVNVPLASIEAGQLPRVDTQKTLYVYCRSGNRSAQATELLKKAGYTDVVDLGAISDVVALGGKQVK